MHTAAHTTQKQQHQEVKLQHKTQMQRPQQLQQKQNDTRKSTQKQQQQKLESDKETIQLSSDDEQTTVAAAAPATPATSSASSNIYALNSGSNAAYEQRNRSCARSRSHSGSSSSLSSTLSSSYRSLDYEAEADEEDANECEGVELQRKLAGGNDNLMHVQNFLNCFDTQERRRQNTSAICCATQPQQQQRQQEMLRQLDEKVQRMGKHLPVGETNLSHISSCVENELATRDQVAVTTFPTTTAVAPVAIATAATMSTTTVTTNAIAAKAPSKPGKFTISTKFLRKPRHKLKSVNLAPTMGMSKTLAATTIDSEEMVTLHERQKVLQQRGNEHVSQQQQQQKQQQQHHPQPIPVDEPNVNVNVKFNSNFSINSLLNKR